MNGQPSINTIKEFKYFRKAVLSNNKLKYWFYIKLSKYYERKYEKEILK